MMIKSYLLESRLSITGRPAGPDRTVKKEERRVTTEKKRQPCPQNARSLMKK